jgi:hypothetical protein
MRNKRREGILTYDPTAANSSERTLLGGLKTKNVDVVVTREGPVLAISCKGAAAEFDFRYNDSSALGVEDESQTDRALSGIVGKLLTYADSP